MLQVIIFDIDGVLIHGQQFSTILERDAGISKAQTLPFFTGVFQQALIGKADIKKELQVHLQEWGWKGSVDQFLDYWFTTESTIDKELVTYIEQLKSKGIHVYVATNQEKHRTNYLWKQLGFSNIFAEIFSSADLGHRKHEQEFFKKLMQKLPATIQKEHVLLWDDTQENIDAAKTFGIHAEYYQDLATCKAKTHMYL